MVVASVVGIAIGLAINWFPAPGIDVAADIDTFWDVLLITSVPVFVIVTGVVLFSIWRWRMRPGEETLDGPPIHGNTNLEVVLDAAVPALLIAALCAYATILLLDIQEAPAKGTRVVNVTGEQFAWTFAMRRGRQADPGQPDRPAGRTRRSSSRSTPRTSCTTSGCPSGA